MFAVALKTSRRAATGSTEDPTAPTAPFPENGICPVWMFLGNCHSQRFVFICPNSEDTLCEQPHLWGIWQRQAAATVNISGAGGSDTS